MFYTPDECVPSTLWVAAPDVCRANICWDVAGRAKSNPNVGCPLAAPKLNPAMNPNLFRVIFLKPLQLLLCILVIRVLNLKLRFKLGYLRLKFAHLSLQHRKLVSSKSKLLAEYRRRTMFGNQSLNGVERVHGDVVRSNVES
jgi:hypothetical protein